jgi:hypothetical protein
MAGRRISAAKPETLEALEAAHALEVSELNAKIRQLQEESHAATTKAHELSRQLADVRSPGEGGLFFASAPGPSETASTRSFTPTSSRPSSPLRRRPVDADLPASVRHKRAVSLNALKARMGVDTRRRHSATLKSLQEDGDGDVPERSQTPGEEGRRETARRMEQFGDEIVYCCSACQGELVAL